MEMTNLAAVDVMQKQDGIAQTPKPNTIKARHEPINEAYLDGKYSGYEPLYPDAYLQMWIYAYMGEGGGL